MRSIKKAISLLIIICLSLSFVFPVFAEDDGLTVDGKAEILNALTIIKGNGVDYGLDGYLLRSEAAAFIVRIMGKEDYILQNKDQYKDTRFTDVDSTKWYAPFVGYCTENSIIAGYLNNTYGPDDYISEKSFLALVLGALEYKGGTDFTWPDVYKKAYEAGIVTASEYQDLTQDNLSYTRAEVVNVLYNALKIKKKVSNITVIQSLINDNIVSRDLVESLGIIVDEVKTSIEQITPINDSKLLIKLNEPVEDLNNANISIYETADSAKTLPFEIESQNNGEISLKLTGQSPDANYSVELFGLADIEGNTTDILTGSFIGYRNPEIKSDFFKISKIETVSKNIINLYFTHPVNINSEIALYYELTAEDGSYIKGSPQTMAVSILSSVDNGVTIFLKDSSLIEGANYTLKVSGDLYSKYGVRLNDGLGDSIRFKGNAAENEQLRVNGVTATGYNSLAVEFNKPVDTNFSQKFINYSVTGPGDISIAVNKAVLGGEGDKKGRVVYLSLMGILEKTKQYKLSIEYIPDLLRQSAIEQGNYPFAGTYPDKTDIVLKYAGAIDKGTILLYFDRPLNPASLLNNTYYNISGVTDTGFFTLPQKVFYDNIKNPYYVKLYLPGNNLLKGGNKYKLIISNVIQDSMGNMPSKIIEADFLSNNVEVMKPYIGDAVIISSDTIKVTATKEISEEAPNISPSNYTLTYDVDGTTISKVPSSVSYIDATTLVIKFDSLDYTASYKLKFNTLKDIAGVNANTGSDGMNSVDVRLGQ